MVDQIFSPILGKSKKNLVRFPTTNSVKPERERSEKLEEIKEVEERDLLKKSKICKMQEIFLSPSSFVHFLEIESRHSC